MYRTKRGKRKERRGVVLLIVLALLGLFAAVGVSFAMLSKSELAASQNFKRSIQSFDGPAPRDLLKGALDQLMTDTTNPQSALRGHSLLRDSYGGWDRPIRSGVSPNFVYSPSGVGAELRLNPDGSHRDYQGVFNGTGIFRPRRVLDPTTGIPGGNVISNGVLTDQEIIQQVARLFVPREFGDLSSDPSATAAPKSWFPFLPYNFQTFDAIGRRTATAPMGGNASSSASGSGQMPTPELYAYVDGTGWHYHWFPFDEDYDAADHNNWFLALERADGTVIVPSFHRPHLVRQLELAGVFPGNPNTFPAYNADTLTFPENEGAATPTVSGRRILFRPRQVDVDANTVLGTGLPANFPTLRDLNGNGIFGDVPEELDVDTDGDGKPDAIWVDLGTRPFRQEDGTLVKPLYAFKVVAMDGKLNMNLAGNFVANPLAPTPRSQLGVEGHPEGHISAFGASPAEINPRHALTLDNQDVPGNPSYDPLRGQYWPIWEQPNPAGTPVYLDPLNLRLLLCGLPPMSVGGTAMPATADNVYIPGRWTNPNVAVANFELDRPGQRFADDDGSMPAAFNANIPNEPTVGTPTIVRGTVSSSLGPVGFQAGRRYPPFTKRAAALGRAPLATTPAPGAPSYELGGVFPKFVNHVHGHFRDGRAYWPGYDATAIGFAPPYLPAMTPTLVSGASTGEFDYAAGPQPNSMFIPPPTYPFDLTTFGIAGTTGFGLPGPGTNWFPTPGTIPYNHANFPSFLQSMQILMTTDDANEFNPYQSTSPYNSPFTNAQIEQMLRFSDIDGSTLDDRVLRLLNFNVNAESKQSVGVPYQYNAVQAARERMRRMWTAESVDLINYSNPPTYADNNNTPGAATYTPAATLLESRNGPLSNDAAIYTSPVGTPNPPYGVLQTTNGSTQHNGKLWVPPAPTPLGAFDLEAPLGYARYNLAGTATASNTILGKELAGRYPVEVLRGRRYDLNRPLTSYESRADYADAERTAMAEQIYVLLYLSAGLNMRPLPANVEEAKEALAQARTLAQLAVNIVDYIDPDNVMTRMRFHPFLNCPSMTTLPSTATRTDAATQWDDIEDNATTAVTFAFGASGVTLPGVRPEELTVMGFEMPDLVINEGVSVTAPDPDPAVDAEITFVWAELFNPWPNETDLDSGAATVAPPIPRGRLFDATPTTPIAGGRTLAQSRFILGVRQNNSPAGNQSPVAPPAPGDFHNTPGYVYFAAAGAAGVSVADGAFTTPRNQPNNGPDIRGGQRLLVEPNPYVAVPADPLTDDPGSLIIDWTVANGPNRFTCIMPDATTGPNGRTSPTGMHDMRIYRAPKPTKTDSDANVVVSLYRIRNPYRDWHAVDNPYIAIDTLELRGNATDQNLAEGQYDLSKSNPAPAPADRKSMERRQPWQGCNRPWVPYRGLVTNPITNLLDTTTTPPRFLEGKFLGFPYMTADATTGAMNPSMATLPWGNQLIANGFGRSTNGPRGNTLYGPTETPATVYATNFTNTQNSLDAALPANASRYMSFPFLNRQLASPLELLPVRLYGSHVWAVPGAGATNDREWRLRFTDDFEFRQDVANNQIGPNYPPLPGGGFNRVYRSREVPWYLNDRKLHPIDLAPNTTYNPAASENRLAPFPNLYRFFEMVETHSRVNGAGGWSTLAATAPPANGAADLRESRVAGKINPNVITDEEVFKAWLDAEESMPFWVASDLAVKSGLGMAPAAALAATDDRYRPINYPAELSESYGLPLGAVRAIAWNGTTSELLGSLVADNNANNKSFVNSVVGANNNFIDFGGFATTMGTNDAVFPGGDLSLAANARKRLAHNQYPGIINGYYGYNASATAAQTLQGLYPGWDRDQQIGSEFFRAFLFSRNGRDALWGTADDKAFTGFGSANLSDTLLRQRNYAHLDFPNDGRYASTASPSITGSTMPGAGGNAGAPGEYITRLGGQWTPRLFDPVPLPYTLDNNPASTATIGATNTITMARRADVAMEPAPAAPAPPNAVEYWTQEWRRNEILGKIASNTTSRSNVFGVWVTVGYFRVEPGTENLLVPLLHEEVGSTTGQQRRHRMFAIIDRTQAKEFTELMTTNPPKIEDNAMVRHYSFIE